MFKLGPILGVELHEDGKLYLVDLNSENILAEFKTEKEASIFTEAFSLAKEAAFAAGRLGI